LVSAAAAVLLVSEQPERLRRKRIEREQVKILRILGLVRVTTITLHCTFPRAICKTFFAAILFLLAPAAQAESLDGFEAAVFQNMPYRLHVPENYDPARKYPLVLFLHGFEALGRDNHRQITGRDYAGTHIWTRRECFVLAPQCPISGVWALPVSRRPSRHLTRALEILKDVRRRYSIDATRLYVTGQSLGGYGTWAAIEKYPDLFAAAVPVCGGGSIKRAKAIAGVPVWAFHGRLDPVVLVHESRRMIAAMKKAGGNPKYTEFHTGLHDAWTPAYREPELVEWVFAQRLSPVPGQGRPEPAAPLKRSSIAP
jgi:predicted peptidase